MNHRSVRFPREEGQVIIFTLLCMTCLFGFVALASDVGILLKARRTVQTAADAAAMAGAAEINYTTTDSTTVDAVAKAAASTNGYTNGTNNVTITTSGSSGPSTGPHAGNTAYVEVVISQPVQTLFMKFFSKSSMTVGARAVAGLAAVNDSCIYITSPSAQPAMHLQGSFNLNAPHCGILINSNQTGALDFTGGNGKNQGVLDAGAVGVVGTATGKTSDSTATINQNIGQFSDPMGSITPPDPSNLTCSAPTGGVLSGTIPAPSGGVACYSGNVTVGAGGVTTTLGTGTYVFTGNVTFAGAVNSGTGGVTIDLNSGSLTENTGSALNLVAPTTGTYHDTVIMAPSTNTGTLNFSIGDATGSITGIIHAPGMGITMQDAGGNNKGALNFTVDVIVATWSQTAATVNMSSYSQAHPTTSPLKVPTLVE